MSALDIPVFTQQSKAVETKSRASVASTGPKSTSIMKHSEKMRENWKLLKFRDKYQGKGHLDDSSEWVDSLGAALDLDQDSAFSDVPKSVPTNDRSRKTRAEKHSSTKKSSSTKDTPPVDETWQRVLQKNKETTPDGKGDSSRSSRRVPKDSDPA